MDSMMVTGDRMETSVDDAGAGDPRSNAPRGGTWILHCAIDAGTGEASTGFRVRTPPVCDPGETPRRGGFFRLGIASAGITAGSGIESYR
jgi:hypothetical protein